MLVDGLWQPLKVVEHDSRFHSSSLVVPFAVPVHLEKSGERILHKKGGLVLHHLVALRRVLPAIALNDVEKHLLVLRHWLALLRQKVLCLVSELRVHRQRVGHSHFDLFYG